MHAAARSIARESLSRHVVYKYEQSACLHIIVGEYYRHEKRGRAGEGEEGAEGEGTGRAR